MGHCQLLVWLDRFASLFYYLMMGEIININCKNCNDNEDYFIGMGMSGHLTNLYHCSKCNYLDLKLDLACCISSCWYLNKLFVTLPPLPTGKFCASNCCVM